MPVPEFQSFIEPLLRLSNDGTIHSSAEARAWLGSELGLTDADLTELLPSGRQSRFANRVGWALTHLKHAGCVEYPKSGHFRITDRGRALAAEKHSRIDLKLLDRYEEHRQFRSAPAAPTGPQASSPAEPTQTPEEQLEQAYREIRAKTAEELLDRVKKASPLFFEQLVVELLLKMGYGRSHEDAGRAIGASGDEGIDGVISEDRLGLDNIYIQAKRWGDTSVGRPEIQRFVGALHGKRARKGVFITTSTFTAEARTYVSHIDPRVVLIDGKQLAEYMLDYGLGVTTRGIYELKRIDSDYFLEE
jgi:restriction system protein